MSRAVAISGQLLRLRGRAKRLAAVEASTDVRVCDLYHNGLRTPLKIMFFGCYWDYDYQKFKNILEASRAYRV